MIEIPFMTKCDIESSINRITTLLNTNIFHPQNIGNPFVRSAFIETLICLRDLMYKSEKFSSRINFAEDVVITSEISDVSDLIKFVRDALCHLDLPNHYIPNTTIKCTFNISYGKSNLMQIGDINISSDYADDVCFFFGEQKIYLRRHIIRAFEEAKTKLLPLL